MRSAVGLVIVTAALATTLTACVGAEPYHEVLDEAAHRGPSADRERFESARDAVAGALDVSPAQLAINRMNASPEHVTVLASPATEPLWDQWNVRGLDDASNIGPYPTDAVDGWFVLSDVPALDRIGELYDEALALRGVAPGEMAVDLAVSCAPPRATDAHAMSPTGDPPGMPPHCAPEIAFTFSDPRRTVERVTFDADGELVQ
ncbi:hypothetical protein ACPYO6_14135 [Georgenia sp. Z1344]|uniref:hypothetical protein n=1 Tax=Georgenia sp. Z1344 TaxID=3416706 RepID=UPI003CEFC4BE